MKVIFLLLAMSLGHCCDAKAGVADPEKRFNTTPIKHVVVLMEENRSFDHLFGCSSLPVEKMSKTASNPVDVSQPSKGKVTVDCNSPYVGLCDPCHGLPCTTEKIRLPSPADPFKQRYLYEGGYFPIFPIRNYFVIPGLLGPSRACNAKVILSS